MTRHLITFVLDETGSMLERKGATISGFNEWMQEVEKFVGETRFTLIKFNSLKHEVLYKQAVFTKESIRLTEEDYLPSGSTPLFDAVGRAIREAEQVVEGQGEDTKVLFVILTDGEENASQEWTLNGVNELIKEKIEADWTFTYLGVSPDAWKEGFKLGIPLSGTMLTPGDDRSTVVSMGHSGGAALSYLQAGGGSSAGGHFYEGLTDESGNVIMPEENKSTYGENQDDLSED